MIKYIHKIVLLKLRHLKTFSKFQKINEYFIDYLFGPFKRYEPQPFYSYTLQEILEKKDSGELKTCNIESFEHGLLVIPTEMLAACNSIEDLQSEVCEVLEIIPVLHESDADRILVENINTHYDSEYFDHELIVIKNL